MAFYMRKGGDYRAASPPYSACAARKRQQAGSSLIILGRANSKILIASPPHIKQKGVVFFNPCLYKINNQT